MAKRKEKGIETCIQIESGKGDYPHAIKLVAFLTYCGGERKNSSVKERIQVQTCNCPARETNEESRIMKRKDSERTGQQPLSWRAKD